MEPDRGPQVPVFAIVGPSGSGKTTLLAGVIAVLRGRGLEVGVIKHSKRFDDPDCDGKDSQRLREAGAARLVLASPGATVAFLAHPAAEPAFEERLALLGTGLDLVLVESYRSRVLPTVEVLRRGAHESPGFVEAGRLIAVAADFEPQGLAVPVLPLDQPEVVAQFLLRAAAPD